MRKICPIVILLLLSMSSKAQRISDTIKVFVEERLEMKLIMNNYDDLKTDSTKASVRSYLEQFQQQLPKLKADLKTEAAEELVYKGDGKIVLRAGEEQEIYIIATDALTNSGTRDKAIIIHPMVRIELMTADISDAINLPLLMSYDEMVSRLPQKTRYAKTIGFSVKEGVMDILPEEINNNSKGDYMELSVGAGANLFKGQWLGEFQTRLDFSFFNKNVLSHNPYVSYSWLYDFSRLDRVSINGFLNVGYQWDLQAEVEEETLFGVEAGYLLNRQGDLFEENTWRLGLNWSPADGITVSPQMYVVGGFEKVQPGVRFTFGL